MKKHPYVEAPDAAYWRQGVAQVEAGALDPIIEPPFTLKPQDKIVTAGSCFAQHIGRYLQANGNAYLITEPAHPMVGKDAYRLCNYGVYPARYGNIYTARQLRQLLLRAYGRFNPVEDVWADAPGVMIDPFRPTIQPRGFNSAKEYACDRARHFAAVRRAFETLDIFIFTFGLTEAWRSKQDGAVFPVCPGVSGGVFSPDRHEFVNFELGEIVADMKDFIADLRLLNPKARVILTVSPVPLVATAEKRHVLVSTIYSKSVLRVACEILTRDLKEVAYFPAYEIVASGFAGNYFASDRRSVTEEGVSHVMRIFAKHYLAAKKGGALDFVRRALTSSIGGKADPADQQNHALAAVFQTMCDEEALSRPDEDAASSGA